MSFTLYHYWRSSSSWRVRFALDLKNIKYECKKINLLKKEEESDFYSSLNPSSYVPTLVHEKHIITESIAIMEWLEEEYPDTPIIYGDTYKRAKIRSLSEVINAGIQPLQNLNTMKRHSDNKEEQNKWLQHWIKRGMQVYERMISKDRHLSWTYSVGDQISMADICLIPQCYSSIRFGIDIREYSNIFSIWEKAHQRKEFKSSHPDVYKPK